MYNYFGDFEKEVFRMIERRADVRSMRLHDKPCTPELGWKYQYKLM